MRRTSLHFHYTFALGGVSLLEDEGVCIAGVGGWDRGCGLEALGWSCTAWCFLFPFPFPSSIVIMI
jgi:hypothetical protein